MYRNERQWLRSPSERVGTLAHADLPPPEPALDEEEFLVRALRGRDERAFQRLLDEYYSPMLRLARTYVRTREEAEEVVQDTWLAVLSGLGGFQGRSSLKTWVFRILVNRARTRARREARLVPFSSLRAPADESELQRDPLNPEWLLRPAASSSLDWHGRAWEPPSPDESVIAAELHTRIEAAVSQLPTRQQEVITLRDLEGWGSEEVCELLGISDANQRVLLHRARLRVREALEDYLAARDSDDSRRTVPAS